MKHDWLEDGHTFPLMQYYTDLVWTRMVKKVMGWGEENLKSMDEILRIEVPRTKGLNILIQGKYFACYVNILLVLSTLLETKHMKGKLLVNFTWVSL